MIGRIGEYDQNKRILVLNTCKISFSRQEITQSYSGYIYANGDGYLYWVEGEEEYDPNNDWFRGIFSRQ